MSSWPSSGPRTRPGSWRTGCGAISRVRVPLSRSAVSRCKCRAPRSGTRCSGPAQAHRVSPAFVERCGRAATSIPPDVGNALPVGRVGEASDIAEAYLYLMRERFSTGQVIAVDGVDPKVAGLVYVAACGPDTGEVVADLGKPYPPPPSFAAPIIDKQGFMSLPTASVSTVVATAVATLVPVIVTPDRAAPCASVAARQGAARKTGAAAAKNRPTTSGVAPSAK